MNRIGFLTMTECVGTYWLPGKDLGHFVKVMYTQGGLMINKQEIGTKYHNYTNYKHLDNSCSN